MRKKRALNTPKAKREKEKSRLAKPTKQMVCSVLRVCFCLLRVYSLALQERRGCGGGRAIYVYVYIGIRICGSQPFAETLHPFLSTSPLFFAPFVTAVVFVAWSFFFFFSSPSFYYFSFLTCVRPWRTVAFVGRDESWDMG